MKTNRKPKPGYWLVSLLVAVSCSLSANTVYLIRHAEKQPVGADPALTDCGIARAEALAQAMAGIKLAAIYTTAYQRTEQTAAIIASRQQLKLKQYDAREPQRLLQQLSAHAGPVLVVGHSNTVPDLVSRLSTIPMAAIDEQDYAMLYQVTTGDNPSVTLSRQAFVCQ
ncbi:MAG: phosphoglycerate mutase family protein [Rheinheimera sp.]|nr:phosphoglycerate mutase family protein [Rheinheimera sp.]